MVKTEMYPIEKKMTMDELNNRIKKVEKDVRVLNRLYFIKNRYLGDPVEIASSKVGVTKRVGRISKNYPKTTNHIDSTTQRKPKKPSKS
jgi:hypothetical protein